MKVLYVITKSVWGGAQKYVYDLATSLPRGEFEPVVAFGGAGPLAEKLAVAGVRTVSIPSLQRDVNPLGDAKSLFALYSVIRKERPDVVHVNSSKTGGLGAVAAQLAGVPRVVFTCHGWPFNEERGLLSLWAIRFFSWLTVMFSDATIAVSERDTLDGQRLPGAKDRVTLVHNGVREPRFKPKEEARAFVVAAARAKGVEILPEDYLVGAIGELHKNKGYEYLLEAVAKPGSLTKLAIMGEGEERDRLERQASGGLKHKVAFLGFVEDAPTYLKAFDAFVLSSIKEGLPYVVIEAGYASLPIVATNVGGVKEIVDDMSSGILVQTRKPDEIAQGIEALKGDREKAALFGANLHAKVQAEFSLEKMVERTVSVYRGAHIN